MSQPTLLANAPAPVPSTKAWLLLFSLLSGLLVLFHQLPPHPASAAPGVGRPQAAAARPAGQPAAQLPLPTRRVALETPAQLLGAATFAPAATL